jgi:hypothetical protein
MKSFLAFWMGGASLPQSIQAGYRGLLAFWSGGAAGVSEDIVTPPAPSGGGGSWHRSVRDWNLLVLNKLKKRQREEQEIMAIITAFLELEGAE